MTAPLKIEASRVTDNDIKALVYQWFGNLDRLNDANDFLPHLEESHFEIRFPDRVMRSHADFIEWFEDVQSQVKSNTHTLSELNVESLGNGRFEVCLKVRWQAELNTSERIDSTVLERWTVQAHDDQPLSIQRYEVEPIS